MSRNGKRGLTVAASTSVEFKQIVLIDDNRNFSSLMRSVLSEFGYRDIVDFENPKLAMDFMKTTFVDVLFLDLVMPGASGFQIANKLRHDPSIMNRMMPIIMVTGHADLNNIRKAINYGIDEVLVKPISPRALYQRLTGVLDNPRTYIKTKSGYYGPDRRRRNDPNFRGPDRRQVEEFEICTKSGFIPIEKFRAEQKTAAPAAAPKPEEPPKVAAKKPSAPSMHEITLQKDVNVIEIDC